jgi:hypothetical protein
MGIAFYEMGGETSTKLPLLITAIVLVLSAALLSSGLSFVFQNPSSSFSAANEFDSPNYSQFQTQQAPGQSVSVSVSDELGIPFDGVSVQGLMFAPSSLGNGMREVFSGFTSGGSVTFRDLSKALAISNAWVKEDPATAHRAITHDIILFLTYFDSTGIHYKQGSTLLSTQDFLAGHSYSASMQVQGRNSAQKAGAISSPGAGMTTTFTQSTTATPSSCGNVGSCVWVRDPTHSKSSGITAIPVEWLTVNDNANEGLSGSMGFTIYSSHVQSWKERFVIGVGFSAANPNTCGQSGLGIGCTFEDGGITAQSTLAGQSNFHNGMAPCWGSVGATCTLTMQGSVEDDLFYMTVSGQPVDCNGNQVTSSSSACQVLEMGTSAIVATQSPGGTWGPVFNLVNGPPFPSDSAFWQQTVTSSLGTYSKSYQTIDSFQLPNYYSSTPTSSSTTSDYSIPVGAVLDAVKGLAGIAASVLVRLDSSFETDQTSSSITMGSVSYSSNSGYINVGITAGTTGFSFSSGNTGAIPVMGVTLSSASSTGIALSSITRNYRPNGASNSQLSLSPPGAVLCDTLSLGCLGYVAGSQVTLIGDNSISNQNPFDNWASSGSITLSCIQCLETVATISGAGTITENFFSAVYWDGFAFNSCAQFTPAPVLTSGNTCVGNTYRAFPLYLWYHLGTTVSYFPSQVAGFSDTAVVSPPFGLGDFPSSFSFVTNDATLDICNVLLQGTNAVSFSQSGLPASATWSARVNWYYAYPYINGPSCLMPSNSGTTYTYAKSGANGGTITFNNFPAGYSYQYTIPSVSYLSCTYSPNPASGLTPAPTISFAGTCNPTFTESGLPSGTYWSVVFNGVAHASTTPSITIVGIPPGTYFWTVNPVTSGGCTYNPNQSSGSFNTAIQSSVPITFSRSCPTTTSTTSTMTTTTSTTTTTHTTTTTTSFTTTTTRSTSTTTSTLTSTSTTSTTTHSTTTTTTTTRTTSTTTTTANQYYLTMRVTGTGSGYVTPASGYYAAGSMVTITGTPNPGCNSFISWAGSGSGSYSGIKDPATITMNGPITETATFKNVC